MNADRLYSFLRELHQTEYPNEVSFLAQAVPEFVEILGYERSNVFFETAIGFPGHYRADAIVAAGRTEQPWILIETKVPRLPIRQWLPSGLEQLRKYSSAVAPKYAVLLSPELLVIISEENERQYEPKKVTLDEATDILVALENPGTLPQGKRVYLQRAFAGDLIQFETFRLDRDEFSELLRSVLLARTNDEKGKTLEELAALLFNGMPFLIVKYRNLRTASSEIDIVVQNQGWRSSTIFDEFGRYFLVECKNWAAPVGAKQVRDFKGKLEKSKVRLGILFAKNGVTGTHSGADALLEIHSAFDSRNMFIIVISEEDLKAIENGMNFYNIVDERIDRLRFGL
jgi:hypothetical protein